MIFLDESYLPPVYSMRRQLRETVMSKKQRHIDAVQEAITEARRLNEAAGMTVFNPAAMDALKAMLRDLIGG